MNAFGHAFPGYLIVPDARTVGVSVPGIADGTPLAVLYANGERHSIVGWLTVVTMDRPQALTDPTADGHATIQTEPIPVVRVNGSGMWADARVVHAGRMPFQIVAADGTEDEFDPDNPTRIYFDYPLTPDDVSSLSAPDNAESLFATEPKRPGERKGKR